MTKFLIVLIVFGVASANLMPMAIVPKEEEPKFKVDDQIPLKQNTPKNELYTNRVYQIDRASYDIQEKLFKNIVLWISDNDDENSRKKLEESISILNPQEAKIDIIYLTSNTSQFPEKSEGLYVKHLQQYNKIDLNFAEVEVKDIASEIKSIVAPSLKKIEKAELTNYFQGDEVKLLLLMDNDYKLFDLVKEQFEKNLKDGTLEEAGVNEVRHLEAQTYKTFSSPSLLLYKGDSQLERYEYNITHFDQIVDFVYLESLPLIVPLSERYQARVFGGSINTQMHLLIEKDHNNTQLLKDFRQAALNNKEQDLKYERVIFTYSTYEDNEDLWKQFNIDAQTKSPKIAITRTNFRKFQLEKFLYDEEQYDPEAIQRFLERFRGREVEQFYISEPVPENAEEYQVTKVVGKSFSEEVIKGKKNVLVLFWDSKKPSASEDHQNILNVLASTLPEDKREYIKISTVDLALNEHPSITIDTAPQLLLYLSGDRRRPKTYNLETHIDQIKAWLSVLQFIYLKYWISDLGLVTFKPEGGYVVVDLEEYKIQRAKQLEAQAIKQAELMAKLQAEAELRAAQEEKEANQPPLQLGSPETEQEHQTQGQDL